MVGGVVEVPGFVFEFGQSHEGQRLPRSLCGLQKHSSSGRCIPAFGQRQGLCNHGPRVLGSHRQQSIGQPGAPLSTALANGRGHGSFENLPVLALFQAQEIGIESTADVTEFNVQIREPGLNLGASSSRSACLKVVVLGLFGLALSPGRIGEAEQDTGGVDAERTLRHSLLRRLEQVLGGRFVIFVEGDSTEGDQRCTWNRSRILSSPQMTARFFVHAPFDQRFPEQRPGQGIVGVLGHGFAQLANRLVELAHSPIGGTEPAIGFCQDLAIAAGFLHGTVIGGDRVLGPEQGQRRLAAPNQGLGQRWVDGQCVLEMIRCKVGLTQLQMRTGQQSPSQGVVGLGLGDRSQLFKGRLRIARQQLTSLLEFEAGLIGEQVAGNVTQLPLDSRPQ